MVSVDYSDPAFTSSLGQTVTSALQTIMIGPNSQIRAVLTEFINAQQDNMDKTHADTQQQLQDMRRLSAEQHKQVVEKLNTLLDQARLANPSKHLDDIEKTLRECQGIRGSLTEFRDSMPAEFRGLHDLILELKCETMLADQTAEQQLESIRDNTVNLKTAVLAFESKVANSFTDMLEHHRGFNSKFAQYHDGQLDQNTSNATIQEIVKGCLQNDARLHPRCSSGRPSWAESQPQAAAGGGRDNG